MNTQIKKFEFKHLIVLTARGTLDLTASKSALKSLVAAPGCDACSEVLLDLREVECAMPVSSIHELAKHAAWHIPALPDDHRIAVLVERHWPGNLEFNHAQFLELCAHSRGFNIRAFDDYGSASDWLNAVSPNDQSDMARALTATPSFVGRRPQFGLG